MKTIDTVDEIDVTPSVVTTYQINAYVLWRYPSAKLEGATRTKTAHGGVVQTKCSQVLQHLMEKPRCTIRNLVTDKEYVVDVTSDPSTTIQHKLHPSISR